MIAACEKHGTRLALMAEHARSNRVPLLFVNQVGGNDELLFDGCSSVVDAAGTPVGQALAFAEDLLLVDLDNLAATRREHHPLGPAGLHAALVLGVRDYVRKCGFRKVLVGLSGGIDSALVAAIAADALGAENVVGIGMPSPYSSAGSIDDSRRLAARPSPRTSASRSRSSRSSPCTRHLRPRCGRTSATGPRMSRKRTYRPAAGA